MVGMKWVNLCNWILNLIILNLLWIMTIILGIVVFGFGPANYAINATIRKWLKDGVSTNPISDYLKFVKENTKENIISGILIILFIVIILMDLLVVKHFILRTGILLTLFITTPIILLYYPVSVHFSVVNIKEKVHLIYQLFLRNLLLLIFMMLIITLYSVIMMRWLPAYFFLFGIASIHLIMAKFLKNLYLKEDVWELQIEEGEKTKNEVPC